MYRRLAITTAVVLGILAAFVMSYPDNHAQGPRYALWKRGVLPLDSAAVFEAMVGDRERERLVVGLTVAEVQRKFGALRTSSDATPYQRTYHGSFEGKEVRWLGDSAWLVVFENGRATALRLMKG